MMVTRRCNMTCAHCSVESAPGIKSQPSSSEMEALVTEAASAGVQAFLFTGGEPMMRQDVVLRLIGIAKKGRDFGASVTTNGFWGPDSARPRGKLSRRFAKPG
jgi:MoaA/NifB/PqqE/SkfB family radical SAM enzyme